MDDVSWVDRPRPHHSHALPPLSVITLPPVFQELPALNQRPDTPRKCGAEIKTGPLLSRSIIIFL